MSLKIDSNGKYQPFFGYSVISMVKEPLRMKYLEVFMANSRYISKYFSPLPADSYHMTLYNIWSFARKLLPVHELHLLKNYPPEQVEKIKTRLKEGWFPDPDRFINSLLINLHLRCSSYDWSNFHLKKLTLQLDGVLLLHVQMDKEDKNLQNIHKLRSDCIQICHKPNDNLKYPHITLGYRYRELPPPGTEEHRLLVEELTHLDRMIPPQIELDEPGCYFFSSMEKYSKVSWE